MKYIITITEYLERGVHVEAPTAEEAQEIVRQQYDSGDIVLGYEDFTGVDFGAEEE